MDFPLHLFPQGGLSSSVVTTVWVGALVVAFFNLRFGWVLSGLVVPGYTVPLLILRPWAAVAILVEAIATFAFVWLLSEYPARRGYWPNPFGRDRFFALLLTSVLVRVLAEVWLLPSAEAWLANSFDIDFGYHGEFQSVGLIVIALIAHQFWKTGVVRGLWSLLVTVGITFVIVRYGLMEYTNFTISNLNYVYEDLATSVTDSAKAYILLLSTAFVASRMNLRYGWDFNGILIPSLLALLWYQPIKLLMTFLEAWVILAAAMLALKLPWLAQTSIEGARKIVWFFNISFFYKWLLGYLMLWYAPQIKVSDAYGFGYLLATLLAIRMHDKAIVGRMTRTTLQTSLTGALVASLVGFGLSLVPWTSLWWSAGPTPESTYRLLESKATLMASIEADRIRSYRSYMEEWVLRPSPQQLIHFRTGLRALLRYADRGDQISLTQAIDQLAASDYRVLRVEGRYLYLRPLQPANGWGTYVVDTQTSNQLLVEIPAPLDEPGTLEMGARLFTLMQGRALAFAGAKRNARPDGTTDVLTAPRTIYQVFHQLLARQNVLQIRGDTAEQAQWSTAGRRDPQAARLPEPPSALWVKGSLPPGLNLVGLKQRVGSLHVVWNERPLENRQRETTARGFAELVLNRSTMRRLLTRHETRDRSPTAALEGQRIEGHLQNWLLRIPDRLAKPGSDRYLPPRLEHLLFFDESVLTPLLRVAREEYRQGQWSALGLKKLRMITRTAATARYALVHFHDLGTQQNYLVLTEFEAPRRRFWGTYVIRLGAAAPYIAQAPRPLQEINSFEYALSLFERLKARALLVPGAHAQANLDGSANVVEPRNVRSLFNLVHQVLLRENLDAPLMVVQVRGYDYRPDVPAPKADALIAFADGTDQLANLTPLGRSLLDVLWEEGLRTELVAGGAAHAGYEVSALPQSLYLRQARNKELAILWLSPTLRQHYRQQDRNRMLQDQWRALSLVTATEDLYRYLAEHGVTMPDQPLSEAVEEFLQDYIERQDIVSLQGLLSSRGALEIKGLIELNSRQALLVMHQPGGQVVAVVNVFARAPERHAEIPVTQLTQAAVADFVSSRAGWLSFR